MSVPDLLVSVRTLEEARAARQGGCDLLDVKEPRRGPLGRADFSMIAEIASYARQGSDTNRSMPCSTALGELLEWQDTCDHIVLPDGVTHAKFGPAGLASRTRWTDAWRRARDRFSLDSGRHISWVAVSYADWQSAGTIPPRQILECALEAGCDVFLVDTCRKDGRTLFDSLDVTEMLRLSREARQAKMRLALAGSLRAAQIPALADVRPDVIAVRGAACDGQLRSGKVSSKAVSNLKMAIADVFGEVALGSRKTA